MEVKTCLVNIPICARCGGNHENLEFKTFVEEGIRDMTHWSLCPKFNEPVLMKIVEDTNS